MAKDVGGSRGTPTRARGPQSSESINMNRADSAKNESNRNTVIGDGAQLSDTLDLEVSRASCRSNVGSEGAASAWRSKINRYRYPPGRPKPSFYQGVQQLFSDALTDGRCDLVPNPLRDALCGWREHDVKPSLRNRGGATNRQAERSLD
jgi:hypothetical protein